MRDSAFEHEKMPIETDKEFVAMVKQARHDGVLRSVWLDRLIEIAERIASQ